MASKVRKVLICFFLMLLATNTDTHSLNTFRLLWCRWSDSVLLFLEMCVRNDIFQQVNTTLSTFSRLKRTDIGVTWQKLKANLNSPSNGRLNSKKPFTSTEMNAHNLKYNECHFQGTTLFSLSLWWNIKRNNRWNKNRIHLLLFEIWAIYILIGFSSVDCRAFN